MLNLHLFEKSFKDIKNIVDQFSCSASEIRRVYSPEMQKIKIEKLEQEARDSLQIEFNLVNHLIKKDREGLRRPEPTFDWQKRLYFREVLKNFSGNFSDIYKKPKIPETSKKPPKSSQLVSSEATNSRKSNSLERWSRRSPRKKKLKLKMPLKSTRST